MLTQSNTDRCVVYTKFWAVLNDFQRTSRRTGANINEHIITLQVD